MMKMMETIKPVAEALRNNEKPTFVYRWPEQRRKFEKLFNWVPTEKKEIENIAAGVSVPCSIENLTAYTVGGEYCKRASFFGDATIPSAIALNHIAIRVTLLYEFAVKALSLRESSHPESSSRTGGSPSGSGRRRVHEDRDDRVGHSQRKYSRR